MPEITAVSYLSGRSLQTLLFFLRAAKSVVWKELSVHPPSRPPARVFAELSVFLQGFLTCLWIRGGGVSIAMFS